MKKAATSIKLPRKHRRGQQQSPQAGAPELPASWLSAWRQGWVAQTRAAGLQHASSSASFQRMPAWPRPSTSSVGASAPDSERPGHMARRRAARFNPALTTSLVGTPPNRPRMSAPRYRPRRTCYYRILGSRIRAHSAALPRHAVEGCGRLPAVQASPRRAATRSLSPLRPCGDAPPPPSAAPAGSWFLAQAFANAHCRIRLARHAP